MSRLAVLLTVVFGSLSAVTAQRAPALPGVDIAVPFQPVSFRQGDHDQFERLIRAEQRRSPEISRDEAALRAARRYERDNR
jgi:hypothetical protein